MRLPSWARKLAQYHRMKWDVARRIAKAAKLVEPSAETYLVGSSVEGTSTIYSDIDIVVCVERRLDGPEARKLAARILATAMDKLNLPLDYPVELKVLEHEHCRHVLKRFKAVHIKPLDDPQPG